MRKEVEIEGRRIERPGEREREGEEGRWSKGCKMKRERGRAEEDRDSASDLASERGKEGREAAFAMKTALERRLRPAFFPFAYCKSENGSGNEGSREKRSVTTHCASK